MGKAESPVEKYFCWTVADLGGKYYKFKSPGNNGVSDRIACMPDGSTWFVELKAPKGRLSELQKLFAGDMTQLNQRYACLWTKQLIDEWREKYACSKS